MVFGNVRLESDNRILQESERVDSAMIFVLGSDESFSDLVGDSANEKNNFAKKVEISAQHIEWLKENQTLLNILLNYCTLHGACGGDVASKLN